MKKQLDNPYILMSILLFLWGSFAASSKIALQYMDNYQVQFYMFGSAAIIMTIRFIFSGKINHLRQIGSRQFGKLILYGLPSYFYFLFYILALQLIPAIEASMLNYLFPILLVVFSVLTHDEKLNTPKVISMLFGFAGMVIIVTKGDLAAARLTNFLGDLLAIGGAVCWALFSNLGKKNSAAQDVSNYVFTLVAFVLSLIAVLLFSTFTIPNAIGMSWTVWLGLSSIVFTYYLWFRGLKSSSSALIASMSFLTPVVTLLFIVVLLGERVTLPQFGGFLFIIAGIIVQVYWGKKRQKTISIGS